MESCSLKGSTVSMSFLLEMSPFRSEREGGVSSRLLAIVRHKRRAKLTSYLKTFTNVRLMGDKSEILEISAPSLTPSGSEGKCYTRVSPIIVTKEKGDSRVCFISFPCNARVCIIDCRWMLGQIRRVFSPFSF